MRKWIAFVLLLLVGAEVFAQGSAPSPPQLWRRKGTADTSFVVIKTGDTVMLYDTAHYVKMSIRGSDEAWLIPDSMIGTTIVLTDRIVAPVLQVGTAGGGGAIVFDNFALSSTFYSLLGNGLENTGGYLTVTLGASIEGSEVTNQTLTKSDIDTTDSPLIFSDAYHVTSASTDSAYKSKYYIDHNLFGYTVTGTPSNGQVAVYDGGTGGWTFGAGGSGSGDDVVFDMTADNSNYVLGATTYTGGYFNTSTVWQRGDGRINLLKSGQHPGDTIIHTVNADSVQLNAGTQSIRVFRDAAGETMLRMEDSSIYTKMTTTNNGGWKFEAPVHVDANLILDGATRSVGGVWFMYGPDDAQPMYISDSSSLNLQTIHTDKPVVIGSSSNWTVRSDTIRASNGQILGIKYASIDTLYAHRELMRAGQFGILTSTDTALLYTRDTANDTTIVRAVGKLRFSADAGLTEMDSVALHGRLRMYDGTNKSRIDSASGISADTLKTLPGGFLTLQGATSGRTRIKGNASAITSYDLVLPAAQGAANQALINDGSGNFSWGSAGTGNGSADFDTTTTMDSNIVKGAGGTILLDVHKNSTPSVVIGKGATMTSLIVGGNNSGLSSVDTSLLINNSLYFGGGAGDYDRLDSQRVVNAIRLNRYYFRATDLYWSPEKYNASDDMFLTWNLCDTTATWPANAYKSELFHLVDSVGDSHRPLNWTWQAGERDTLLSFKWKYASDSLAGTGSTDTSKIMYPNYALLYVNRTQVDSVFIGKTYSLTPTEDSVNFTDRAIAPGDVVTVMIWFETQVTATSAKRVRCEWAYLNMRRY